MVEEMLDRDFLDVRMIRRPSILGSGDGAGPGRNAPDAATRGLDTHPHQQ
jgi:hypothetical protein